MELKTILVHVDQSRHAAARIRYAAALARAHDAHLIGAAMTGLPQFVFPEGAWPIPQTLASSCFTPLYDNANRALDQFAAIAAEYHVASEKRLVTDQDAEGLALLARFCDLVVMTQDDPDEALPGQVARLPDYVALNATAPVVVLPLAWAAAAPPGRVLLAWNGSIPATRAVYAALPLLRRAAGVRLVSFCGPTEPFADTNCSEQPQLAASLARHGIPVEQCLRDQDIDAGHAIMALADETGSDLVVMGCYGHSRFREMLLGGATRTMLRAAKVPVLMMH
jgi:nucleotide-binding universal stress UspA family protein